MSYTPQTNQEFLDGLALCGSDANWAAKKVLEILQAELPVKTALLNEVLGLTGTAAIPVPKTFGVLPFGGLPEGLQDALVLGFDTQTQPNGIGGVFHDISPLSIYSVGKRAESPQNRDDLYHRALAIRGVLWKFLGGFTEGGATYWHVLEPTGYGVLPEPYQNHAGVRVTFTLRQDGSLNRFAGLVAPEE